MIDLERAVDLGLELGLYAYDTYILDAARSSGYPLLALDGLIQTSAKKMGLPLVELDLLGDPETRASLRSDG